MVIARTNEGHKKNERSKEIRSGNETKYGEQTQGPDDKINLTLITNNNKTYVFERVSSFVYLKVTIEVNVHKKKEIQVPNINCKR